jgi:hypothetical protein
MAEKALRIQRVPADKVQQVIKEYEIDSPASVTKIDNNDGTFDLMIFFGETPFKSGSRSSGAGP